MTVSLKYTPFSPEREDELFHETFVKGYTNRMVTMFLDELLSGGDDWQEDFYEDHPKRMLGQCTTLGQQVLVRGTTGVGKTNTVCLMLENARSQGCRVAINVPEVQGVRFIDNFEDLDVWLDEKGPKCFAFDDAALFYSGRRAMSKEHETFRKLHLLTNKKDVCLIWVEHMEKMVDIDVRRFATWVIEKPYQQLSGQIDNLDMTVATWVKKTAWVWRRGEQGVMLKWWTDCLPMSEIKYDRYIRGRWRRPEKGAPTTRPPRRKGLLHVEVPPPPEGESFRFYTIRRAREEFSDRHSYILELTYKGMTQVDISVKMFGTPGQQSRISIILKEIHELRIGYWWEDYWRHLHGLPLEPDTAKSTPGKPDALLDGVYWSLKHRWSPHPNHTFYPEEDFAPELAAARAAGHAFIMLALANAQINNSIEAKIDAKTTKERIRVPCPAPETG